MKYINIRTLVRAGTAVSRGDTMFLRECVRTPLIPRSDSLHHRIRVVFNWINERDGCDAPPCAHVIPNRKGESVGASGVGGLEDLQHDNDTVCL